MRHRPDRRAGRTAACATRAYPPARVRRRWRWRWNGTPASRCTSIWTNARARSSRVGLAKATAPAGRGRVHERHGCRGAVPRRRRGVAGSCAALPADRRPAAAAARHRREPDDRPGAAVRDVSARVPRPPGAASPDDALEWRGSDATRWRRAAVRSRDRCTSTARSTSRWCRQVTSSTCRSATRRAWSVPDRNPEPLAADVDRAARELSGARGVVVAGSNWWMASSEVALLAQRLGWPLLAEPTSGLRQPGWAALAAGQSLIASTAFVDTHRPEVVLQIGATPTTRASQAFVASAERLLVVDLFHPDPDPEQTAAGDWRPTRTGSHAVCWNDGSRRRPTAGSRPGRSPTDARDASDGRRARRDRRTRRSSVSPGTWPRPSPTAARSFVGNSTPIRDLDVAMAPRDGLQVLANRGASGIDGLVSTALGVATAGTGPTVASDRRPLVVLRRGRTALERATALIGSGVRRAEQPRRRHLRVARSARPPRVRPAVRDAAGRGPRGAQRRRRRGPHARGADVATSPRRRRGAGRAEASV